MNQENFLGRLVAKLEVAGIPYMITGWLGSSLHGEPRASNDLHLVSAPTAAQLTTLIQSLSEGYYVSPKVAQEALLNYAEKLQLP